MKTLLIDNAVFNLNSSAAEGLITGLNLLHSKEIILYTTGIVKKIDPSLLRILQLEKIELLEKEEDQIFDFYISSENGEVLIINNGVSAANFRGAAAQIISLLRFADIKRKTRETDIYVSVSLDSNEESNISTGIGFFDHMLAQIARHGNITLGIKVTGDLEVDEHHTVEDTGIALGTAISEALGNKAGLKRYGFCLPMDDCEAACSLDLGGRAYLKFNARFNRDSVGGFPTELAEEFFRALASGMKANINLKATGKNDHHKIESLFKAFAKALNEACRVDLRTLGSLPSTKGVL